MRIACRSRTCTGSSGWSWAGTTIICTAFAFMAEITASPISVGRTLARTPRRCRCHSSGSAPRSASSTSYDFTAGWQVEVRVERGIEEAPRESHRIPVCVAGREPGPPDGCGGPGFMRSGVAMRSAGRWRPTWTRSSPSSAVSPMAMPPSWRIPRRSRTLNMPCPATVPGTLSGRSVPACRDQRRIAAGVHHSAGFPMIRMAIQVVFIDDAGDRRDMHEIVGIDRDRLCPAGLGLSLAEAKEITGGIQQVLAGVQVAEWQADQRACPDCGNRRSMKGHHPIVFRHLSARCGSTANGSGFVHAPRGQRARLTHWRTYCASASAQKYSIWKPSLPRWFPTV